MSATDELRRLLDERGAEWRKAPHYSSESQDNETIFEGNGIEWYVNDHMNGRLGLRALRYEVTPEQAVEATLGKGTCRVVSKLLIEGEYVPAEYYEFEMECGEGFKWDESEPPRYCPNCGRKVVDA